jgi:tetratricopeptide (TPR) repeat protein
VHMPSRIGLRVGDFESSADVNKAASAVDRRYIESSGDWKSFYSLMYYSHNLHFVSYVRMMQGKFDESIEYARQLRRNVDGAVDGMPMLASYSAFEWLILTRFNKWNEMLAEPEPKEKNPFVNAMYRYSRALAFARLGRIKEAEVERERMAEISRLVTEQDTLMNNSTRSVLEIGLVEMEAKIARANKDVEAEIAILKRAVELQDALKYMEPPEWHYPIREALGGALLRHGKTAEAEAVFRKDLEINPRNGRSLFGLMEALKMQGKTVSVKWVEKEFSEAWKYAPASLTIAEL